MSIRIAGDLIRQAQHEERLACASLICEWCAAGWPLNGYGDHAVEVVKNKPHHLKKCAAYKIHERDMKERDGRGRRK